MTSLLTIVLTLAIVGFIIWLITTLIPMPDKIRQAIYAITLVFVVLWLLQSLGVITGFGNLRLK